MEKANPFPTALLYIKDQHICRSFRTLFSPRIYGASAPLLLGMSSMHQFDSVNDYTFVIRFDNWQTNFSFLIFLLQELLIFSWLYAFLLKIIISFLYCTIKSIRILIGIISIYRSISRKLASLKYWIAQSINIVCFPNF